MKKVIVRLGNGLGNQLFTYAASYSFSKKNNSKLFVDDESGFYKRYKYELHNFNITAPIVDTKYKFLGFKGKLKRRMLIKLSSISFKKKFLIEKRDLNKLTEFNIEQLKINFDKILYFEGYFQSEKYFKFDIKDILNEFTFKNEVINQNSSFAEDIKKNNSVSIHLRQDKYLLDENHKNLNELNKEFIDNNISIIKRGVEYFDKKIENPKYFVWSNNFLDLNSIFPNNNFIFVNENFQKDIAYDLYLMSLCKHYILSPSTLHYWGAYLSQNTSKICLAPKNIKNKSGYYGFSNNKDIKPIWWKDF